MNMSHTSRLLFACAVLALGSSPAIAQTCRWDGTAPYCAGECGPGETEEDRGSAAHMVTHLPSVNPFGNGCVFGTKAYCCQTPGITCRWDGTAPFCDGECDSDETETKRCGSCSGKVCWTGSKARCCKSTGSTGQPLVASPELTRYAAIWDKSPGPEWVARHGMTSAQYQAEFDKHTKKGYRPVVISGYGVAGKALYAAIWEKRAGPAWVARHGMTSAQYQQKFQEFTGQGYRLVHVSAYGVGGKAFYAAIWDKSSGPAWAARHGMTAAQYQAAFNEFGQKGYRLTQVSGFGIAGKDHYAAIWEKRAGPAWVARHGLTSAQFQETFNDLGQKGYRLTHVDGYGVGGQSRYAAIWEETSGPAWMARHGMTADGYQEEFNFQGQAGYRLRLVSGFHPYY